MPPVASSPDAACRYGTSGNIGLRRDGRHFFVSPTGMAYESLEADDIPLVDCAGRWFGRRRPSSEWRFHRDIFKSRDDVGAIVHTHSRQATALACTGRGIPAFHYMVAVAGGTDIRCAPYHTFGSQELSDAALAALDGPQGVSARQSRPHCTWVLTCLPRWRWPERSRTSPRNTAVPWLSEQSAFSTTARCAACSRNFAPMAGRMQRTRNWSSAAATLPAPRVKGN